MESKVELKNAYEQLINNQGNYSHILTLTFNRFYSAYDLDRIRFKFLNKLNRRIHGQRNKDDFIEYAMFKENKNRNVPHYHILLKYDEKFYQEGKATIDQHVDNLFGSFRHITRNGKEFKFSRSHNDLTLIKTNELNIGYFTKEYWKNVNFDFIELKFNTAKEAA